MYHTQEIIAQPEQTEKNTLCDSVSKLMSRYFANLEGEEPFCLYNFVIEEFEEPLLRVVMNRTGENQSEAARILGISRGTLRKKLKTYGMLNSFE